MSCVRRAPGLTDDPAGAAESAVPRALGRHAHPREALEHQLLDLAPDARRPELVARSPGRGDGYPSGGEARCERAVERQSLKRVVVVTDDVEQPAEPPGVGARAELADLPVVARGEVGLVGVRVADAGEDGDLPLAVKLMERRRRRVPLQAGVLGPGRTGAGPEPELRPQPPVVVVVDRGEDREGVDAALEEDRDEDLALRAGRAGDPLDERLRPQHARSVDAERQRAAAEQQRAAGHAGSGRGRHPRLDRRQPAAGLGERAPGELGAGELPAAAAVSGRAHDVWNSGLTAIRIRSAFWRRPR